MLQGICKHRRCYCKRGSCIEDLFKGYSVVDTVKPVKVMKGGYTVSTLKDIEQMVSKGRTGKGRREKKMQPK